MKPLITKAQARSALREFNGRMTCDGGSLQTQPDLLMAFFALGWCQPAPCGGGVVRFTDNDMAEWGEVLTLLCWIATIGGALDE